MMSEKNVITTIENEFYALIGQIGYGELSDITTYWLSLSDALLALNIDKWDKPDTAQVSSILQSLRTIIKFPNDLADIASEMEGLSAERGSTGELEEEDLDRLQRMAEDFEAFFVEFLETLRDRYGA
jgi:hypothetical protein